MAHANIEERRIEVGVMLSAGRSHGIIKEVCAAKYNCNQSAIWADIYLLSGMLDKRRKIGIYFLKYKGKIVYIGQTINYKARVRMHKYDKKFDSIRFIECVDDFQRMHYEKRLIAYFNPKYNKAGTAKKLNQEP